jgi:predicted glycoside hydrolase/deacetylase ChbG (UPF0249 family)
MRWLVINADDMGADRGRNQGILEGIRAGVLTSVSVLANGPRSQEAMEHLREAQGAPLSVGLHLNLSEGKPLSGGLHRLVGQDGSFLGKAGAHMLLKQGEEEDLSKEVALELEAQLKWALSWGVPITHINGHQHVHVFPAVVDSVIEAARRFGISWIRLPLETRPLVRMPGGLRLAREALAFSLVARKAMDKLKGSGVQVPDLFCGLHWKGLLSPGLLGEMLRRLPDGLTELMVHPGRRDRSAEVGPFSSFSGPEREKELEALLHPGFRGMLKECSVILTEFPARGMLPSSCVS